MTSIVTSRDAHRFAVLLKRREDAEALIAMIDAPNRDISQLEFSLSISTVEAQAPSQAAADARVGRLGQSLSIQYASRPPESGFVIDEPHAAVFAEAALAAARAYALAQIEAIDAEIRTSEVFRRLWGTPL